MIINVPSYEDSVLTVNVERQTIAAVCEASVRWPCKQIPEH